MKKILTVLILLLALAGCGGNEKKANPTAKAQIKPKTSVILKKSAVPTLFIHGYSGTKNSFGGMLQRLETSNLAKKELIMTVSKEGSITTTGTLSGKKDNPMIQVIFQDNKNTEWSQSEWLYNCLADLKKMGVEAVNLVGHSMGGVSGLRYMMSYPNDPSQPEILKFVAIGAPFNDFLDTSSNQDMADLLKNGPTEVSSRYQDYQKLAANLAKNTKILLLAGQLDENTFNDEMVPTTSALAVNALLKQTNSVTTQIFYGPNAQHSQLHENKEVDKKVSDFLWPKS